MKIISLLMAVPAIVIKVKPSWHLPAQLTIEAIEQCVKYDQS